MDVSEYTESSCYREAAKSVWEWKLVQWTQLEKILDIQTI
jgi:hypothetical protein